jgi:Ribosomally synthesized peptide prototyped by Frankia Franean1_4349.
VLVSRRQIEAVLGRALVDQEFRLALFADPDAALAGYDLTAAERTALKSVDAENLDACAHSIGRRVARGLSSDAGSGSRCGRQAK